MAAPLVAPLLMQMFGQMAQGGTAGPGGSGGSGGLSSLMKMLPFIGQLGIGAAQTAQAGKINTTRPVYEIADEYNELLGMLKTRASGQMPGADFARNEADRSQANAMDKARKAATSPNQIMEAAVKTQINRDRAGSEITAQNEAWRDRAMTELGQGLRLMGQEKEKQFNINEMMPWQMNFQAKNQFQGAGMQNMFGALTNAGSFFAGQDQLQQLMGMLNPGT